MPSSAIGFHLTNRWSRDRKAIDNRYPKSRSSAKWNWPAGRTVSTADLGRPALYDDKDALFD